MCTSDFQISNSQNRKKFANPFSFGVEKITAQLRNVLDSTYTEEENPFPFLSLLFFLYSDTPFSFLIPLCEVENEKVQ